METKNLIQASANVVKITSLSPGDVVKYVDTGSYSSSEIKYGVVLDMLNDGEKSFIQILLYSNSYSEIKSEVKLFEGSKDVNIFPATVTEVEEYLDGAISSLSKKIEDKAKELDQMRLGLTKAKEFVSMETSKKLSEVSFKEVTQVEYNRLKTDTAF
tara:strand:- start:7135 stop:7605 length:471 start_codon:yes stop_codon:yes gene_type:complete